VVGVVPDVVFDRVQGTANSRIYQPTDGTLMAHSEGILLVRLEGAAAPARLRQLATSVQPAGSRSTVVNVRDAIDGSMAEPRFLMRILVAFAAVGVALAAIGLFGVISYTVGRRTREIGVRMTLGATRGSIARLVVGDGIRLAIMGIGIGLAGASAATRLLEHSLYGVSRLDPIAFVGGAVVLLAVSTIACIAPTVRATSIDPALAVRVE
jgi:putative ABC transport system permease protein